MKLPDEIMDILETIEDVRVDLEDPDTCRDDQYVLGERLCDLQDELEEAVRKLARGEVST